MPGLLRRKIGKNARGLHLKVAASDEDGGGGREGGCRHAQRSIASAARARTSMGTHCRDWAHFLRMVRLWQMAATLVLVAHRLTRVLMLLSGGVDA